MKEILKKSTALILCITLFFTFFANGVSAAADSPDNGIAVIDLNNDADAVNNAAESPDANEGLTYSIVLGTFTLSGKGAMPDYSNEFAPWYESRNSIRKAVIEEGITNVSGLAFYDCGNLTEVSLPSTLESIGTGAFHSCGRLGSVTIPKGTSYIGWYPFAYCTSLKSINVENGNKDYVSDSGVLFNKARTTLLQYPVGKSGTSYTVPSSVKEVGMGAFAGSKILKNVTLSRSQRYIESYVFNGCTALESVTIGRNVDEICEDAFDGCTRLKDVYFEGSYSEWSSINIESGNSALRSAKMHYNSGSFDSGSSSSSSATDSFPVKEATVEYRATVKISVNMEDLELPPLFSIAIFDENGKALTRGTNYYIEYTTEELTRDRTFTVKVLNILGTPLENSEGEQLGMKLKIHVKDGFFDRFIAFFQGLFGLLPKYTWEFGNNV